jgi:hypothetical protein
VQRNRNARIAVLGSPVPRSRPPGLSSRSANALKRRIVAGVLVLLSLVLITIYVREPAGGGALLNGLDERLRHETQMPVHLAESPLTCVAVGSGRSLEEFEAIHRSQAAKRRNNHRPRS